LLGALTEASPRTSENAFYPGVYPVYLIRDKLFPNSGYLAISARPLARAEVIEAGMAMKRLSEYEIRLRAVRRDI